MASVAPSASVQRQTIHADGAERGKDQALVQAFATAAARALPPGFGWSKSTPRMVICCTSFSRR